MTRRLALLLCNAANRLLPPRRKPWGAAMTAELVHAADDRSALAFAGGCLLAAACERARDFDTRFTAGLWSVALATIVLAAIITACAARGVGVLLGAPDGMYAALVRGGADPLLIATYERARPIVVACFLALGLAQFATAWFLVRADLRHFWRAWWVALIITIAVVAIQLAVIWSINGLPTEFHALLLQAAALPALLAWSNGGHHHQEKLG